jgi:hypothetical protein
LLGGIRSMFGGQHGGGPFAAYDQPGAGGSPLSGGGGGSDRLAHEAGLDDVGHEGSARRGDADDHDRAGLIDTADNEGDDDGDDYDDGGGADSDTDYA